MSVMSEVFTFVDATHLITKAHLWEERDRAIETVQQTPTYKPTIEHFESCTGKKGFS